MLEIFLDHSSGPAVLLWEPQSDKRTDKYHPKHQSGRYSYLQLEAGLKLSFLNNSVCIENSFLEETPSQRIESCSDPLRYLKNIDVNNRICLNSTKPSPLPPFYCGFLGVIGYDIAACYENISGFQSDPNTPHSILFVPSKLAIYDRLEEKFLLFHSYPEGSDTSCFDLKIRHDLEQSEKKLLSLLNLESEETFQTNCSNPAPTNLKNSTWQESKEKFIKMVERAKEYIAAGDIFQVVLSNVYSIDKTVAPEKLYASLLKMNTSAFHFSIPLNDGQLVGASPETMLRAEPLSKKISMRLIAGTYPKDSVSLDYARSPNKFMSDEKETAEHLMLVDHCRNDIGRVSKIGTVKAEDLFTIDTLSDVHHLVSRVSGILLESNDIFSALKSCMPIATLTGTPKIRAMEIVSELESEPRRTFGGAICQIGFDGFLDSAVVIRTALVKKDRCIVQAGAGIVSDSIPEREYEECKWKTNTLVQCILSSAEK